MKISEAQLKIPIAKSQIGANDLMMGVWSLVVTITIQCLYTIFLLHPPFFLWNKVG
jgi:hypothetical protein